MKDREVREVEIRETMIRLGQFLKLAALAGSGADAKRLLGMGTVRVNGEGEVRRGRQLHEGDVVTIGPESVRVVCEDLR